MGSELVKVTPSLAVSVNYASNLPQNIVMDAGIVVMSMAAGLVAEGIRATSAIVQAYEETKTRITLYQREGQILRECVIPTVALYHAIQSGRDLVNRLGLDDDLRLMALQDLDRNLQRYRTG